MAEEGKKKVVKKRAARKKAAPKTTKLRIIARVTHKGRTHEVGEVIDEHDPEMVKQLINLKVAEKV